MDLRDVAGELYAAAPADFIARRNAAAAEADKPTAKQIKTLRKPSASAAAINALVREHPDLVGDVLDIGSRMRDAFASRDRAEIRALTQERQRLLQRAAGEPWSVVLYEAPPRLVSLLEDLITLAGPDRAAVVARELTKLHEEVLRGNLSEVLEELKGRPALKGEFVLVIGGSTAL